MDLQLKGKAALVTGSSSGIGAAIAQVLALEQAAVVVHGRDESRAKRVVDGITKDGGIATYVVGDLRSDESALSVFTQAESCFGKIDILVNNAGSYTERGWFETTPETWKELYDADVISAIRLIQAAVPGMRARAWGRIIQIATSMASTPQPVMADYAAAKAALVNATVSLAKALSGTGITCNTISPGLIQTTGVEPVLRERAVRSNWGTDWQVIQRNWMEQVLGDRYTKRFGKPNEIADLVAFVASPRADYLHGANIRIDGGNSPSVN